MSNINNINVLVVTHNSRIRCFLSKIMDGAKMLRFKNCAILKIVINIQQTVINIQQTVYGHEVKYNIELIYGGETSESVDKSEDKFYTTPPIRGGGGIMQTIFRHFKRDSHPEQQTEKRAEQFENINDQQIDEQQINDNIKQLYKTITLYVVRHAEGKHNKKGNIYKGWVNRLTSILQIPLHIDPDLSDEGVEQAKNAGNVLTNHENGIKFDYAFTSELRRTRETAYEILQKTKNNNIPIYPIPCIHEVSNYAKGLCDDFKLNSNLIRAPENKSKCFEKYNQQHFKDCKYYNEDWAIYQKLNKKCSGTDLVQNVLNAISNLYLDANKKRLYIGDYVECQINNTPELNNTPEQGQIIGFLNKNGTINGKIKSIIKDQNNPKIWEQSVSNCRKIIKK
jgi:broad specificity phosphatase PhoE